MEDAKDAAQALLEIQRTKLELAWKYAPATMGGRILGVSLGNVEYGRAYIHAAGDWIAAANQVLGEFDSSDTDPVIDQLGAAVDTTVQRRNQLFNLGLSLEDPLADATKEYYEQVRTAIAAALAWLKKHAPDPGTLKGGAIAVIAILALVVMLR